MADIGIKISQSGSKAFDSTIENFVLHSSYVTPKAEENNVGISNYTFPDNPAAVVRTLVTVAHGYSYKPAGIVYIKDVTNSDYYMLPWTVADDFMGNWQVFYYETDETNLNIYYECTDNSVNMTGRNFIFKYYVFVETGA